MFSVLSIAEATGFVVSLMNRLTMLLSRNDSSKTIGKRSLPLLLEFTNVEIMWINWTI